MQKRRYRSKLEGRTLDEEDVSSDEDLDISHKNIRDAEKSVSFNAAKYLYSSYRVAENYPDLRESRIVLGFTTTWPRNNYREDMSKAVNKSYNAVGQVIGRYGFMIIMHILGGLVQLPFSVQDMITEAGTDFMVGYVALAHLTLFGMNPLLVLFPSFVLGLALHFILQCNKGNYKLKLAKYKSVFFI